MKQTICQNSSSDWLHNNIKHGIKSVLFFFGIILSPSRNTQLQKGKTMQIAIAIITLALCGGFLYWFKRSEDKKRVKRDEEAEDEHLKAVQKTAQEFVNAKDLGQNCLYTIDGMIFAYIKIEGLCLELLSRQEQKLLCRQLSSALSGIKRPYKSIAVSRLADISIPLQEYEELYNAAEGGRKKLLKFDMEKLAEMVITGESLERQHYIAVWDTVQHADERAITAAAADIAKKYNENGIHAELLDRKGIVQLCNLVNNPAYVHVENPDIEEFISVLAG